MAAPTHRQGARVTKATTRIERRDGEDYFWEASISIGVGERLSRTGICRFAWAAQDSADKAARELEHTLKQYSRGSKTMSKRFGVFLTPKPVKPQGRWMNDGDQDGDRWEGSHAEAAKQAEHLRKLYPDCKVEVRAIRED